MEKWGGNTRSKVNSHVRGYCMLATQKYNLSTEQTQN